MQALVWILDVAHRARRFECEVPKGMRALEAVEDMLRRELGVAPLLPIGVRSPATAPEFMYLLPDGAARKDFTPASEWLQTDQRGFEFYVEAMLGGWSPPTRHFDVFYFGDTPELAATLAHLVMKGVKRGTTTWLAALNHDGSTLPTAGMVSIVTDRFGHALCAIRSEQIELVRFAEINETHAHIEGESDRTLADWRIGHLAFFGREAQRLGLTFHEDEVVVFERFSLIAVLGRPD